MLFVDSPPASIDVETSSEESAYPLIREKYFKEEPTDMVTFQNLIHLVPEVVNQLGKLLDVPQENRARIMSRLYQVGLLELVTICTNVVIEDFASLKIYAQERLASILLAEVDMI